MRIVCAIQSRMGSTRLRKKALRKISGRTVTEQIFRRLKAAKEIDEIVLAAPDTKENNVLIKHAKEIGLNYCRGSENDIISRLYGVAKEFEADALVRITGDSPLIDPKIVDKMVNIYRKNYKKIDFLTNNFPLTLPDGLDFLIISISIVKQLMTEIKDPFYREQFVYYILENSKKFRNYHWENLVNLSFLRLVLDYPEDLVLTRKIFKALDKKNKVFTMEDILNFLKKNPSLLEINAKRIDWTTVVKSISRTYSKLKKEEVKRILV